MFFRRHQTIRLYLAFLVTACVVPVWLIAGFLVFNAYSSKSNQVNRNLLETARAMTMIVDRELASVQSALFALATSPSFEKGDFKGLHRQILDVMKSYPGADCIVADATGQQLVNSYRPYGSVLPVRNNLEIVRSIFESGKPVVSDLFFGAVTKRPLIGIDVPVMIAGKVAYDLSMTFSSDRLASILAQRNLDAQWYGVILDGKQIVVARTLNPEQNIGKRASSGLRQALMQSREGTAEYKNIEDVPVLAAFSQSLMSGWTVVVGVPKSVVMADVYLWIGWAIGGAAAISLIGMMVAIGVARRIAQDIQALVSPALAIGRGEEVTAINYQSVKETTEVAAALVKASELLQSHARERDRAEKQLSMAINDLHRETEERLRTAEELRKNDQMLIQQSRLAAMGEMIGNIAHQWRQPLNALGLAIQQLVLFYDLGELNRDFLEKNVATSMALIKHMSATVDDFSNYFKPDKEKIEFRISEVIAKTLALIEDSFKNQRIRIEVETKNDPIICGYRNEFAQVILNILNNAKDAFLARGIESPRITIITDSKDNRAVLIIRDNAGGIPEEIVDKIFDPYFTTKGPQQGTGVGLFMSKNIIEKNMSGRLSARNADNGAEFRIEV